MTKPSLSCPSWLNFIASAGLMLHTHHSSHGPCLLESILQVLDDYFPSLDLPSSNGNEQVWWRGGYEVTSGLDRLNEMRLWPVRLIFCHESNICFTMWRKVRIGFESGRYRASRIF